MHIMGIDIGTTSISLVLVEKESGNLIARETADHQSFLKSESSEGKIQDPERIYRITREKTEKLNHTYGLPAGIGVTGQMHGMLYVDEGGNAVSPLYTWQDGSGDIPLDDGKSSVQILKKAAGAVSAGYGLATHYYLQEKRRIPKNAKKMTTISDYIVMKLCALTEPEIGMDMAASWGCFDLERKEFRYEGLKEAGVDISYLPRVRKEHFIAGRTAEGIPVMGSIGDNQASFLGSVDDLYDTVLINVGTGSQVTFASKDYVACGGNLELRPCMRDSYIMAGSSLCGGRAYAMLEQFYREVSGGAQEDCYKTMQEQASDFIEKYGVDAAWKVKTAFSGTRNNPSERGEMTGIGIENFHPGAMTAGVIAGIVEELHQYYVEMCELTGRRAGRLVGSGNGLRRNPLMQKLVKEMFGLELVFPRYEEEAACGAVRCMHHEMPGQV